jgi:hypothetical protein
MPVVIALAGLALGGAAVVMMWVVPALTAEGPPVAQKTPPPLPAVAPAAVAPAAVAPAAPSPPDAGPDTREPAPPPPRPSHKRGGGARAVPAAARSAPDAAPGHLTVTAATWGAVYVDGKQVAAQTPLYRYALPAGRHTVKLFQPSTGRYSRARPVEVKAGQLATVTFP